MAKMMQNPNRISFLILMAGIIGLAGAFLWEQAPSSKWDSEVENVAVHVFKVQNGWGYNITTESDTLIHQPFIPSIEGRTPFLSREQAEIAGQLVGQKIESGLHPAINSFELDSLGITTGDGK